MMVAGTLVTGTGPLAGAGDVPRYHFLSLTAVTQLHADIGWVLGTLAVMLALIMHLTEAPPRAVRLSWIVLGLIGLQGAIGYAQYFSGLPAGLVWVHVANTALIWIAVIRLTFALRDRGQVDQHRCPPPTRASRRLASASAGARGPPERRPDPPGHLTGADRQLAPREVHHLKPRRAARRPCAAAATALGRSSRPTHTCNSGGGRPPSSNATLALRTRTATRQGSVLKPQTAWPGRCPGQ